MVGNKIPALSILILRDSLDHAYYNRTVKLVLFCDITLIPEEYCQDAIRVVHEPTPEEGIQRWESYCHVSDEVYVIYFNHAMAEVGTVRIFFEIWFITIIIIIFMAQSSYREADSHLAG